MLSNRSPIVVTICFADLITIPFQPMFNPWWQQILSKRWRAAVGFGARAGVELANHDAKHPVRWVEADPSRVTAADVVAQYHQ